jgi:TatD DNase family protein
MICDAHTHVKIDDLKYLEDNEIYSMACAMNPIEAKELIDKTINSKYIHPTCGIHPFESDKYTCKEIFPYLKIVKVIGEIGMDKAWCKVDFATQRSIFLEQLNLAEELNKPVIIHCKAMERATAEILENYNMEKIIHWYSSFDCLDLFFDMDCYFTIGPGLIAGDQSIINLVKRTPLNRIMVESDGIDGINWALNGKSSIEIIKSTLNTMVEKIAEIKKEPIELVQSNIERNFFKFF